jgi:predicted PurR-regulated permease PerM
MPEILSDVRPTRSIPVSGATLTSVLLGVIVVAALYFGRDVLVPIALAVLLSFVLSPLVGLLKRWYVPRGLAVGIVALVAFAAIFGLGALMVSQVNELASDLPRYQSTLREKIQALRGATAGTGTLERASEVLQDLSKEIDKPKASANTPLLRDSRAPGAPIPVEVRQPDPGALQTVATLITPLIHPLTTTGIVIIFVIFILGQHQDLRNRLIRLAGAQDLQRTTAAMDEAGERLSRLFLTQLGFNAAFGLVIGIGLAVIGVPSAPLWGMLAAILRFVPYIGAPISAIFPLVLAAAVAPGWTMVLWTAALFLIVEPIAGHVIEPLVYGRSAGLSPVAVIVSATFWTWLWGPIGLVLSTPLTICMVVLGRHVDRLKFLEVMFGDEPPLTPAETVYQRMLARDPVEAAEQAQSFLREKPLVAYYDEILLEGLRLAEADAERGQLDQERMEHIRDAVADIIEDLAPHQDKTEAVAKNETENAESPLARLDKMEARDEPVDLPPQWRDGKPVVCVPGLGLLDEAAARMLADLAGREGIGARAEPADALSMSRISAWDTTGVALVCLCYVENPTPAQIRYAVRRLRRRAPDVVIMAAFLGRLPPPDAQALLADPEFAEGSLRAAVEKIRAIARAAAEKARLPRPTMVAAAG